MREYLSFTAFARPIPLLVAKLSIDSPLPPILFRVKKYHSMAGQISATSFIRMSRVSSSIIVANSSISSLYRLMRQVNIIVRRGYSYYSL